MSRLGSLNYAKKYLDWEAIVEAARNGTPAEDLAAAGTKSAGVGNMVPTGLMLIRRVVLEALGAQPERWHSVPEMEAKQSGLSRACEVFRAGVVDGVFLSEDFMFCREAEALGFETHLLDANTSHCGNFYYTHLPEERRPSVKVVKETEVAGSRG